MVYDNRADEAYKNLALAIVKNYLRVNSANALMNSKVRLLQTIVSHFELNERQLAIWSNKGKNRV